MVAFQTYDQQVIVRNLLLPATPTFKFQCAAGLLFRILLLELLCVSKH